MLTLPKEIVVSKIPTVVPPPPMVTSHELSLHDTMLTLFWLLGTEELLTLAELLAYENFPVVEKWAYEKTALAASETSSTPLIKNMATLPE